MYTTKRKKIKKKIKEKTYKAIMVGYAYKHTIYMYNLYNPEFNRVIMTRDI